MSLNEVLERGQRVRLLSGEKGKMKTLSSHYGKSNSRKEKFGAPIYEGTFNITTVHEDQPQQRKHRRVIFNSDSFQE
jgi:hypothetical protein